MQKTEVLKSIFDKNITEVIKIFAASPKQLFSLSQITYLSGVKTTTSMHIINKLIEKNFVDINVIGKTKSYQWKKDQRTDFLIQLLRTKIPELSEIHS